MTTPRNIRRLRAKAKNADELANKLEASPGPEGDLMRRVIDGLRAESMNCRALIAFFEFATQHEKHR